MLKPDITPTAEPGSVPSDKLTTLEQQNPTFGLESLLQLSAPQRPRSGTRCSLIECAHFIGLSYLCDMNVACVAAVVALSFAFLLPARADVSEDGFTPLPPAEAKAALDSVQHKWRARSGETATEMLVNLQKSIRFKPYRWYADTRDADGKRVVSLTWTRRPGEKEEDNVGIAWVITDQGPVIDENDRLFGLGSTAFALNEAQNDLDNQMRGANTNFLRDLKNLDFVNTPNGKLGDVLSTAGCTLGEPLYVVEVASGFVDPTTGFVRFQATVDCPTKSDIPVAAYSRHGALIALKLTDGASEWTPTSFLAARIWRAAPSHWFDVSVLVEDQVLAAAKNSAKMADKHGFEWIDVARVIELRNSGKALPNTGEEMHAFETAGLLLRIQSHTNGLVRPAAVETFLRHAGLLATTMSDQGIIDTLPMFFMSH